MTNEELWKAVLTEMELSLSRVNFITWFKGTAMIGNDHGTVTISVPSGFVKEWLGNKFNKQIFAVIRKYQPEVREIRYLIGNGRPTDAHARHDFVRFSPESLQRPHAPEEPLAGFDKRYTFDSFVVGPNNELAHAATLAVAKKPGTQYNPLFIYGGVGLGKTHLLQAAGNYIGTAFPEKKTCYISTERLIAHIVDSFKTKTTEQLKQKFHGYDVLVVDDIQFISGKASTQDIFFSIFNELYGKNRQIILSSDRPPATIAALEERLRSRFEGGMIADIGIPEYETRLAILSFKTKEKGCDLDIKALEVIASSVQKNIRELEGALTKVIAVTQMYNRALEPKEIQQILGSYLNAPFRKPTPQLVLKSVADFYRIPQTELMKRTRRKEVVRPRQIAMFLLREEIKYSFPEIGTRLGGRDHSTVIHACMKIREEEVSNDTTRQELNLIKERIYQGLETA